MGLDNYIVAAVKAGDLEQVKDLLAQGADLHTTKSDASKKRTLLHHACQKGHALLAAYLIELGIQANVVDHDGKTPLYYAAEENFPDVAHVLLKNGAQVNVRGDWNPLARAAEASFYGIETVKLLLDYGANVNLKVGGTSSIALFGALRQENIAAAKLLIERGSNVNHVDANGESPVVHISHHDRPEHLRLLLYHGAKVDGKNSFSGDEALHHAASGNQSGMIAILVEHGAKIDSQNNTGKTPLHKSVEYCKIKAAKAILAAGAKSNIKDKEGFTAYDYAKKSRKSDELLPLFDTYSNETKHEDNFWSRLKSKLM